MLRTPLHPKLKNKVSLVNSDTPKDWKSRRRPQLSRNDNVALKYEEVADQKKSVLQLQQELLLLQKEHMQSEEERKKKEHETKLRRDEEVHFLQMKILEMDVKLKEEQLKALQSIQK